MSSRVYRREFILADKGAVLEIIDDLGKVEFWYWEIKPGSINGKKQILKELIPDCNDFKEAIAISQEKHKNKARAWDDDFKSKEVLDGYKSEFQLIDTFLSPWYPKTILDIGCAYAQVSELFQIKYNSELYLLDGDGSNNKLAQVRDIGFGEIKNFQFYTDKIKLIKDYDRRGMLYNFIDVQRMQVPKIKFDLIISGTSCGFHYSLDNYVDLIALHSHDQTKIIMDLRKEFLKENLKRAEVIDVLSDGEQGCKALIKLK